MNKVWSKEVFARNLKMYMEEAGKNQREMAEIIGVSAPTFNEWIKAKKYPRIDKIEMLANYFGIMKSDLIEEKTEQERITSSIMARIQGDDNFYNLVAGLVKLDEQELEAVNKIVSAFRRN